MGEGVTSWRLTKLPKRHLLTIKEMDLLNELGRLSGYHEKFKLSGDSIKDEMATTSGKTTKTLRDHMLKEEDSWDTWSLRNICQWVQLMLMLSFGGRDQKT